MKLWEKDYKLNEEMEKYTVGNDYILDRELVAYDCIASIAHAKVLEKAGVLSTRECESLCEELQNITELHSEGKFEIHREDEDCHTAIENHLIAKLGDIGKKIHTARSRNDQVVTALRLYSKAQLEEINYLIENFITTMQEKIAREGDVKLPGYTHARKAMPFSFGQWLGCFIESMEDNKIALEAVYRLIDQNPLGSGAGFGIPVFDIDREFSAQQLGFRKVLNNTAYVQLSRGKFEANIISALSNIMLDLNKMATDIILFSMSEFAFFTLPQEMCTGSSIMPQKLNPDVLEIMRAKYHQMISLEFQVKSTIGNLMSGYQRDLQLTKSPLLKSFAIVDSSLRVIIPLADKLLINKPTCEKACSEELYATEEAYKLVKEGIPFREAYKIVAKKFVP